MSNTDRYQDSKRTPKAAATDTKAQSKRHKPKIDFTDQQAQSILACTRDAVESAVRGQQPGVGLEPEIADAPAFGVFVTLRRPTLLRACLGRWGVANESLGPLLVKLAGDTTKHDHRFPSITTNELPYLAIDVSLMYDPADVQATGEDRIEAIEVGRHGLVINHPQGRGLLLPHVATEAGWDAKTFLDHLARKAGLPPDTWRRDPQSKLMTFQTKLWTSNPPQPEVDIQSLQSAGLHQLLAEANRLIQDHGIVNQQSPALTRSNPQPLGIHLLSNSGATATAVGSGHSLLELTAAAARSLKEQTTQHDSVKRVTLLWQPIDLKPADYPTRHMLLGQSAIRIRCDGQWQVVVPEPNERFDTVGRAMMSMRLNSHSWQARDEKETIDMTAFSVMHFESREKPPGCDTRQPARAGQFYPAGATELNQAIDAHLATRGRSVTKKAPRAVMLPHAGWAYCGDTIGKTLSCVELAKTVILIGPKHTPYGAAWSVSSHQRWQYPGSVVPIATDLVQRLTDHIPQLVCEPEAHRLEHCCEVLLPFLHRLEPDLQAVPVVIGQSTYESVMRFADSLASVIGAISPSPLLVISSDMNHFATEPENRRLDHMALDAMLTGDPRKLYETCSVNQISMCGLLPAVAVMEALRKIKPLELELIDYSNSAAVTGDSSRVVGYAGVVIT